MIRADTSALTGVLLLRVAPTRRVTPGALDLLDCHGAAARYRCYRSMTGRHFVCYGGGHRFALRLGRH